MKAFTLITLATLSLSSLANVILKEGYELRCQKDRRSSSILTSATLYNSSKLGLVGTLSD